MNFYILMTVLFFVLLIILGLQWHRLCMYNRTIIIQERQLEQADEDNYELLLRVRRAETLANFYLPIGNEEENERER